MRPIDADAFIKENAEIIDCEIDHPKYQDTLRELIEKAPTVEAEARPHGEWVCKGAVGNGTWCSVCDTNIKLFPNRYSFCPTCGADMRKKVKHNE